MRPVPVADLVILLATGKPLHFASVVWPDTLLQPAISQRGLSRPSGTHHAPFPGHGRIKETTWGERAWEGEQSKRISPRRGVLWVLRRHFEGGVTSKRIWIFLFPSAFSPLNLYVVRAAPHCTVCAHRCRALSLSRSQRWILITRPGSSPPLRSAISRLFQQQLSSSVCSELRRETANHDCRGTATICGQV